MEMFVTNHGAEFWSFLLAIVSVGAANLMRLRPRLRYSVSHSTAVLVDEPLDDKDGNRISDKQILRTARVVLTNTGLQSAKNVEITFVFKPKIFNIMPIRRYDETISSMGQFTLSFSSLAPQEQTSIDLVAINGEIPIMTAVRSDDCVGKSVIMQAQRIWPTWWNATCVVIFMLGLAGAFYVIYELAKTLSAAAFAP